MKTLRWLCFLLFCFGGCKTPPPQFSIYHWKAEPDAADSAAAPLLLSAGVQHVYVRLFDVAWSEVKAMPEPVADLRQPPTGFLPRCAPSITPVVFITAGTFAHLDSAGCAALAQRVARRMTDKMRRLADEWADEAAKYWETTAGRATAELPWDVRRTITDSLRTNRFRAWREVQIDCDWTPSIRDKYFYFLSCLKPLLAGKELSVTVRLFPYKYPQKMGVPPADRGMLMAYNLSPVSEASSSNSVFTLEDFRAYFPAKKYPLLLDAALPVFGWWAHFRGPRFLGIRYGVPEGWFADTTLTRREANGTYRMVREAVWGEAFLRAGDVLRPEWPNESEVAKAREILLENLPGLRRLAYYHWDAQNLSRYDSLLRSARAAAR